MIHPIPTGAAAEPADQVQELMRLAGALSAAHASLWTGHPNASRAKLDAARAALETAIRAALAHPAATAVCVPAEPIAWMRDFGNGCIDVCTEDEEGAFPVYASPAASTAGAAPETPETSGVSPSGPGSLSQAPTIPDANSLRAWAWVPSPTWGQWEVSLDAERAARAKGCGLLVVELQPVVTALAPC